MTHLETPPARRVLRIFASPPCGTFSVVRELPGGPPVLRGTEGTARYGLPELTIEQKELVKEKEDQLEDVLLVQILKCFHVVWLKRERNKFLD